MTLLVPCILGHVERLLTDYMFLHYIRTVWCRFFFSSLVERELQQLSALRLT